MRTYLKKNRNKFFSFSLYSMLFFSIIIMIYISSIPILAHPSYFTPAPPSGASNGDKNTGYQYIIYTIDTDSYYMFDWGDGTFSDWIKVGKNDTYIVKSHSWSSYGEYEVKIKHKNEYLLESSWSKPLFITIEIPSDLDNDGWINSIEQSYETDPNDPDDYPIDTDNDGIPDFDSQDGNYIGDLNDDNDVLSDEIEKNIGSNPQNNNDIIIIEDNKYCFVDTNEDGKSDIFYNLQTGQKSKILYENGKMYIDIDFDGEKDHIYDGSFKKIDEFPWLQVITGILFLVVVIVFVLIKLEIIYFYDEYVIEE